MIPVFLVNALIVQGSLGIGYWINAIGIGRSKTMRRAPNSPRQSATIIFENLKTLAFGGGKIPSEHQNTRKHQNGHQKKKESIDKESQFTNPRDEREAFQFLGKHTTDGLSTISRTMVGSTSTLQNLIRDFAVGYAINGMLTGGP